MNAEQNINTANLVEIPKRSEEFIELEWHNIIENDIKAGDRIFYLLGSTGSGKSEWAMQYAAKRELPFLQISCKPGQELAQWIGSERIVSKEFRSEIPISDDKTLVLENAAPVQNFCLGPLAFCVENPSVILIDEPNYLLPTEKAVFQELLNNGRMTVLEANGGKGKVFVKHPETIIVMAANPTTYAGTQIENLSFINRIHSVINVPDWPAKTVAEFVLRHAEARGYKIKGISIYARYLGKIYEEVKRLCREQEIPYDISIRQVMAIIRKLTVSNNMAQACARCIVNGMYINNLSEESIASVRQVVELNAGNCEAEISKIPEENYGVENAKTENVNMNVNDEDLRKEIDISAEELAAKLDAIIKSKITKSKKGGLNK